MLWHFEMCSIQAEIVFVCPRLAAIARRQCQFCHFCAGFINGIFSLSPSSSRSDYNIALLATDPWLQNIKQHGILATSPRGLESVSEPHVVKHVVKLTILQNRQVSL
jgi:hypothetical protein